MAYWRNPKRVDENTKFKNLLASIYHDNSTRQYMSTYTKTIFYYLLGALWIFYYLLGALWICLLW